jgi:hypothetical protein
VISDRSRNTAYLDKSDEKSYKEVKFLEPLMVLKHRDGMVKVAEYVPDALMKKFHQNQSKPMAGSLNLNCFYGAIP